MIKCLIIDDEPLAREGIANYVKEVDFLELAGMSENPIEASQLMSKTSVDLLFLDIQMPKINGIDFLKTIHNPPMVIITTAFPSYAIEGFQLDVMDYLLKPITFQRFFKAVNKAKDYFELTQEPKKSSIENEEYFFIKCENKFEKIKIDDILFIEGMQNYITLYTQEKKFITLLTLKSMEEKLANHSFLRVHKSYIIATNKVDGMEGNELFIGANRIPISRNYKDEVVEKVINQKLWKK